MGRLITSPTICYGTLLSLFLVVGDVQGNDIDENKEGTGGTVRSEYIIQLMFVGIVVGAFNTHVLTRVSLQIPYTVLLFVQGMLLALLMKKVPMGTFGIAADVWGDVDPELLLFIFLPVLIFGEAMTLNWHQVQTTFWQCFLLAVPGVIISTALTAGFSILVLPDWNWQLCFIFGSIVSATDPVAVVAILKSAGASPKLTTLIIGESLMNDGTAMIFFSLFFGMLEGKTYSGKDIAVFFLKMAIGSPLVGVVIGLFFVFLLGQANRQLSTNDVTVQISLSLCCAYIVFFVAQILLDISGVIACCGAGLMFAWLAPPLILQQETMHSIWNMLEWIANTLLFLLAGFIVGSDIFYNVDWTDYAYVVMFYVVLQYIRLVAVFTLYPLLSRMGQKCTVSEAGFMSWAGLRGALGMSLALIVKENHNGHIDGMKADRLFFYVGGIAALTLIINATFTKQMLYILGILRNESNRDIDKNRNMVIDLMKKGLRRKMRIKLASLLEEAPTASGPVVASYIGLLVEEEIEMDSFANGTASSSHERWKEELNEFTDREHTGAPLPDVLQYVRAIFLGIVRIEYWKSIESGKMPREAVFTNNLLYSIDTALDCVHKAQLRDWESLCTDMTISSITLSILDIIDGFEQKLSPLCTPYHVKKHYLARNDEMKAYMLTNFIEAHENAQRRVCNFMGRPEGSDLVTPEEQAVIAESVQSVSQARQMLTLIDATVVGNITSKQTARSLLKHQTELVLGMKQEGLLNPSDASEFLDSIAADMARVERETKQKLRLQRNTRTADGIGEETSQLSLKTGIDIGKGIGKGIVEKMKGRGKRKGQQLKDEDASKASLMLDTSDHSSGCMGMEGSTVSCGGRFSL